MLFLHVFENEASNKKYYSFFLTFTRRITLQLHHLPEEHTLHIIF